MAQRNRDRKEAATPIQDPPKNDVKPALTLSQLEAYLWESANILREPVDAADFKT